MIPINQNLKQHAATGCAILLGVTLLFTLIAEGQQWYGDWQLAHQSIAANTAIDQDETAQKMTALPEAHLFGQNLAESGDTPITSLQLRVTGIVKADTEDHDAVSKAYISISGQPSKIFQAGDSLPYGVKVYAITNDTVILENKGRLEKLPLPRTTLEFKQRSSERE